MRVPCSEPNLASTIKRLRELPSQRTTLFPSFQLSKLLHISSFYHLTLEASHLYVSDATTDAKIMFQGQMHFRSLLTIFPSTGYGFHLPTQRRDDK